MPKTYYITTPIYYVNDSPHIGHAYTNIAADIMARFKRLDGYEVMFLTGTDEHGQKVAKSAEALGVDPQTFTDEVSLRFQTLFSKLNISNNDFIRTTEPRHKACATAIWKRLVDNGHIYLGAYEGWYSVRDEAFYSESELIDGIAPSGSPVEWVKEPSYFFDLSKWGEKLLEFYEANPDFILPKSRRNEVISFVKSGLIDLSVSRTSFSWGIPIPDDGNHVMYVWLDALTNYLSAIDYPDQNSPKFQKFWPCNLHLVGKDILRFHTIYWPAFLMAADLPCPKRVFAHGWWTNEGQKISKSLGNTIDPMKLISEFGLDQTRYFLVREIPFGNDGNYSRSSLINRINSELANNIGNLVMRTLSLIYKNCNASIPNVVQQTSPLLDQAYKLADKLRTHMDMQEFSAALEEIIDLAKNANIYIDHQAPWALKRGNPTKTEEVLYILAETIRIIAIGLLPFIPDSAGRILDQLDISEDKRNLASMNLANCLTPKPILAPEAIFPRFVEE